MLVWITTAIGLATVAMLGVLKQMVRPLIESGQTIRGLATRDGLDSESRGTGVLSCFELPGIPSVRKEKGS